VGVAEDEADGEAEGEGVPEVAVAAFGDCVLPQPASAITAAVTATTVRREARERVAMAGV